MPNSNQGKSDDSQETRGKRGSGDAAVVKLGKYLVERKIGSGGMGAVYAAVDQDLKRRVALKVLPKDKAENPTLVKRFKAEARSAAQLEHQNIIRVYESGEVDGQLFIAMEFVDGIDIHKLIQKRGRIPPKRSIEIMKQACQALQHAHEANVVHRDIKPSNLMLTNDGMLKLADMGLARIVDDTVDTVITRAGTTVGTVDFMAPEQARDSKAADIRSDIYSLGCTWYQMLTGSVPFPEGSMTNKLHAHATKSPPDPRLVNDDIPASIVAVIQKMMAKKKEDRYQTPAELLLELDNANLKRAEISRNSLEALAQEAEDSDFDESVRHIDSKPANDELLTFSRSKKGKSSSKNISLSSDPKSIKGNVKSQNHDESIQKSGKYKKKEGKETQDEIDRNKFQFDIKPIALLSFIAVSIGIGYGLLTIIKGFGDVFDNNGPTAKLPLNNEPISKPDPQSQLQAGVAPELNSGAAKAPTVDEYLANQNKKGDLQVNNAQDTVLSSYGQDKFGSFQERLTQPVNSYLDQLDMHLKQPDPAFKIAIGRPIQGIPLNDSLTSALAQTNQRGGVIEFTDSGPYIVTQPVVIENSRIILTAAMGVSPIIVYRPANQSRIAPMWQVNRGELQLRGMHLSVNPKLSKVNQLTEVISVNGGMLTLVDSSISLQGSKVNGLSAIALQNTNSPAICYIARSSIKGNGLQCIKMDSRDARLIVKQSLLISGSAPVIKQQSVSGQLSTTLQDLMIEESLLVANEGVFSFTNCSPEEKPTFIRLHTRNTILGIAKNDQSVPLVRCAKWPDAVLNESTKKQTRYLAWSAVNTVCSGWNKLVEINPASGAQTQYLATVAEWNKHFDQQMSSDFLSEYTFPVGWSLAPEKVNSVEVKQALKATSLSEGIREKLAGLPIVDPLLLPLEKIRFDEMMLSANDVKSYPSNAPIIRCDLSKENLGDFLNNPKLPTPVIIEVTGVGIKQMNPCRISNKSVRLVFPVDNRAGGTAQLIIRPKLVSAASINEKSVEQYEQLINLDQAELDIIGGYFQIPASSKDSVVNWFIKTKGSKLSLQSTYVEGPLQSSIRHAGLIKLDESTAANRCYILKSFLRTQGSSLLAEDRQSKILVQDSAFVSFKSSFEISPLISQEITSDNGLLVQIDQSTFLSGRDIFHFKLPDNAIFPRPIGLIVTNSVFGPGLQTNQQKSQQTALAITNQPLQKLSDNVFWRGIQNAYSHELVLQGQGMKAGVPIEESWTGLWLTDQEQTPRMGVDAAFLANPIDKIEEIVPEELNMHQGSQAANPGSGSRPLGAELSQLQIYKAEPPPVNKVPPKNQAPVIPKF